MLGSGNRAWGKLVLAVALFLAPSTTRGDDERTWQVCSCRLGDPAAEAWYHDRTCAEGGAEARVECRRQCEHRHEGWWPGCGDCSTVDTGTPCRR